MYQQTVVWHVDDLLVSHIDPVENTKFVLSTLENCTIRRHQTKFTVHDYLGVDYGLDKNGEATVSQIKYVQRIVDDFP